MGVDDERRTSMTLRACAHLILVWRCARGVVRWHCRCVRHAPWSFCARSSSSIARQGECPGPRGAGAHKARTATGLLCDVEGFTRGARMRSHHRACATGLACHWLPAWIDSGRNLPGVGACDCVARAIAETAELLSAALRPHWRASCAATAVLLCVAADGVVGGALRDPVLCWSSAV